MSPLDDFERVVGAGLRRAGIGEAREGVCGVALSGGADSVALLAALTATGWRCVALHCNFGLRGPESERDERFAREVAARLGAEIRVTRFDTLAEARRSGQSVEMAARRLRYAWFAEEAQKEGLRFVAVGHHRDDNIETMLLNLLRGSGLTGAAGIRPRRLDRATGTLYVRPMLAAGKDDILAYLERRGLPHVTDSSNLRADVRRNRLRLEVLPALEAQFPDAAQRLAASLDCLDADRRLLEEFVEDKAARYLSPSGAVRLAEIAANERQPATLLFRLLQHLWPEAGLAMPTVEKMLHSPSGRVYEGAGGFRAVVSGGELRRLADDGGFDPSEQASFTLAPGSVALPDGSCLDVERVALADFRPVRGDNAVLWLGAPALGSRLALRHPRPGERMRPFGLRGTKLVADLLAEASIPPDLRPRAWVVESKEILWLVGIRAGSSFPVSPSDPFALKITHRAN